MELEGLGKELWQGIDDQEYVDRERESWDRDISHPSTCRDFLRLSSAERAVLLTQQAAVVAADLLADPETNEWTYEFVEDESLDGE